MKELISISPWSGQEILRMMEATPGDCDAALAAMHAAFPAWSGGSRLSARREALAGFARILGQEREAIVALLIQEAGKVRADAEVEADLLTRKIAITLDQGLSRTPMGGDGPLRFRPRGPALCLGPFNFPLHLLHGLVVPALAVGCTVVAKPSERCPALGALYGEIAAAAGLEDVLRVVQGGHAVAQRLLADERVATVAAVGGRAMGLALARSLASRPQVVLALELGGVNQALVLEDASLQEACAMVAEGAWRMAGQRCTATRIVQVPRRLLAGAVSALSRARLDWLPGEQPDAAAGPMISSGVREAFQAAYRQLPPSLRLVAGSAAGPGGDPGVSCAAQPLLLEAVDASARALEVYREEQFGPCLIVDPYDEDDLEGVLQRMAANPYRLAASVFTASRERFRACAERLPYGQVNWNRPTAGARSEMPFGGVGRSGNGRPAAVAACAIFADETVVWE